MYGRIFCFSVPVTEQEQIQARSSSNSTSNTNTSANTSVSESVVTCKTSEDNLIYNSAQSKPKRNIVGSLNTKALNSRGRARCIQSKAKKQHLPTELPPEKDREQGRYSKSVLLCLATTDHENILIRFIWFIFNELRWQIYLI